MILSRINKAPDLRKHCKIQKRKHVSTQPHFPLLSWAGSQQELVSIQSVLFSELEPHRDEASASERRKNSSTPTHTPPTEPYLCSLQ